MSYQVVWRNSRYGNHETVIVESRSDLWRVLDMYGVPKREMGADQGQYTHWSDVVTWQVFS